MTDEFNCTQFFEPYPDPGTEEASRRIIPWLITFIVSAYRPYHYYLLTSLLVFSFFANFLIVIVLSQKEMRSTGVNVTMILIALCDFFCSVAALFQLYLRNYSINYSSYLTAYSQISSDYLAVSFHASSLYFAVGMAFCRFKSLNFSDRNRERWQTPNFALRVAFALCAPVFAAASLVLFINEVRNSEEDGIYMTNSDLALANNCLFQKVALVTIGTLFKAIPCALMLLLSILLLGQISDGKKKMSGVASNQSGTNAQIDRTSRFIQVVLVVFLVTESPQALFSIIGGLFLVDYVNYFQNLSIFFNVLSFINTSTSFIIYSSLSSKFRKLFVRLFFPRSVADLIYRKKKKSSVIVPSVSRSSRNL